MFTSNPQIVPESKKNSFTYMPVSTLFKEFTYMHGHYYKNDWIHRFMISMHTPSIPWRNIVKQCNLTKNNPHEIEARIQSKIFKNKYDMDIWFDYVDIVSEHDYIVYFDSMFVNKEDYENFDKWLKTNDFFLDAYARGYTTITFFEFQDPGLQKDVYGQ